MTQKILIALSVFAAGFLAWSAFFVGGERNSDAALSATTTPVVRMEGDTQVIHVLARGGYQPNIVEVNSGIPTRLEVETKGTYDCSASFTIPALSIRKMLPATGVTTFDIPQQEAGSTLHALCSMGMYTLDLHFN
jgi:heme/copper-type cytochrome/quinol oxidase subunit 2